MKVLKAVTVCMICIINLCVIYYTVLLFCDLPSITNKIISILLMLCFLGLLPMLIIGIIFNRIKLKKWHPFFNRKEYKIFSCIFFVIMMSSFVGFELAKNLNLAISDMPEMIFLIPIYPHLLVTLASMIGDKDNSGFDHFP